MGRDLKIVLPGDCNANCSFCFTKSTSAACHNWSTKLAMALRDATPEFQELNITGGEPTISPYLGSTLGTISLLKHKFPKVVLTTNGSELCRELVRMMEGVVDHLNISRHSAFDSINQTIFGTNKVPMVAKLKEQIRNCNQVGIDVSLSVVMTEYFKEGKDLTDMIELAKHVGATAIRIRRNFSEGLEPSILESTFNTYKAISESRCPVCRTKWQLIDGMKVAWILGVEEPSDIIVDDVYEAIFQPSGVLTLDYAGKKPFSFGGALGKGSQERSLKDFSKATDKIVLSAIDSAIAEVAAVQEYRDQQRKLERNKRSYKESTQSSCGISGCGNLNSCGYQRPIVISSGCGSYSSCGYSGC